MVSLLLNGETNKNQAPFCKIWVKSFSLNPKFCKCTPIPVGTPKKDKVKLEDLNTKILK